MQIRLPSLSATERAPLALAGRRLLGGALLFSAVCMPLGAAGGISVSPVRVELAAQQPIATLRVINRAARITRVQTEVYRWTQEGGQDHLDPDESLLVTPPIFEVGADSEQVVRLGFLDRPQTPAVETAYRIFFREIPRPGDAERGVQLLLRIGIPVFLLPEHPRPRLELLPVMNAEQDSAAVQLANVGNVHLRLDAVDWLKGDTVIAEQQQLRYLHPGQQLHWPMPDSAVRERADILRLRTGQGAHTMRLPSARP